MNEVLRRLIELASPRTPVVLCSVVATRGSTPQKPGAALLVLPAGGQVGTLGGGCVEAEVRRRSLGMLTRPGPAIELLTFQLDDDYGWDDGLICGGRMTILAERVDSDVQRNYFSASLALSESGSGHTEVVVLDDHAVSGASAGSRLLFNATGEFVAGLRFDGNPSGVASRLKPVVERPRPYTVGGVSYLPHPPRCRLVIAGAGHVGKAVAQLAAQVDFEVWVVDDRAEYASRERFPDAARLIVGDIAESLREMDIDERTYVVIVTRGHTHDEAALHAVVERPAGYIGMIGSRRKVRLIFDDLIAAGVDPACLARVHAPIGLDIGSQTVPEIALSIVAQLVAHRNRCLSSPDASPRRMPVRSATR